MRQDVFGAPLSLQPSLNKLAPALSTTGCRVLLGFLTDHNPESSRTFCCQRGRWLRVCTLLHGGPGTVLTAPEAPSGVLSHHCHLGVSV